MLALYRPQSSTREVEVKVEVEAEADEDTTEGRSQKEEYRRQKCNESERGIDWRVTIRGGGRHADSASLRKRSMRSRLAARLACL